MRTVAVRPVKMKPWRMGKHDDHRVCGFCSILMERGYVAHEFCKSKTCPCAQAGHPATGNPGPSLDTLE